jgi:glycosyltransferase involved in cell wall biosynthesis
VTRGIRLTVLMTHPVQYYAPWFRHIAANCPEIELTVLYAAQPTPEQQGVGFGMPFAWDVSLTDGYRHRVVRSSRQGETVSTEAFWGLDVPECVPALRESRPDVVLINGWHSVTLVRALFACRRLGIPVLYRGDTNLESRPRGWRSLGWSARTRFLLSRFSGYLSVGRRTREYLEHLGRPHARIEDSPHCVDNTFFSARAAKWRAPHEREAFRTALGLSPHDWVVLFVGKLEPKKRPIDAVRAVARLRPAASLLIVGAGELWNEVQAEAHRLGVRVAWTRFMNQSEMPRAYAAADCLVLPSDSRETWGLVVNEALAAGLPCVVSTRVGCAPDLIRPGETGELFEACDVAELVSALDRVRQRTTAGHDWSRACRKHVDRYSFERATAGLLELCTELSKDRKQRHGMVPQFPNPRVLAACGGMVVVGGLERMTFETLSTLRKRGAAVHCIVNSWENHRIVALAKSIEASWSTGSYRFPLARRITKPLALAQSVWDIAATSLGFIRDALRFRPTHVLIPEFTTVLRNAPALALVRFAGVPILMAVQNAPDLAPFYRRIWRWAINPLVDVFVCNSRFTQEELLAHGVPRRKVRQIYNTVPSREQPGSGEHSLGAKKDSRRIIYVGQLIPEKGADLLLDAVGLLVVRGIDATLDIVGEMDGWVSPTYGGYRERLRARAAQPDLAERVRFLGFREDVPQLLAGSSVHCCPSRRMQREAFGLVVAEAKKAGLPSVVTDSGALPELVTHLRDGWICRDESAGALAEGLAYFLLDETKREQAQSAALSSFNRFARAHFAEAWWQVFQDFGASEEHSERNSTVATSAGLES